MIPILSVIGKSGSGKTTLIEKIVKEFKKRNLKVGVVKHTEHEFDMDIIGKDSYRHKKAGADIVMLLSSKHTAIIKKTPRKSIKNSFRYFEGVDLIIIEGLKKENWPKIEVFRNKIHKNPINLNDTSLVAIASDTKFNICLPIFKLNEISSITNFIIEKIMIKQNLNKSINIDFTKNGETLR